MKYIKPEIEIVNFETADVLMTSGEVISIPEESLAGNNYKDIGNLS